MLLYSTERMVVIETVVCVGGVGGVKDHTFSLCCVSEEGCSDTEELLLTASTKGVPPFHGICAFLKRNQDGKELHEI